MKIVVNDMPYGQNDCLFCKNGVCQLDNNEYSDKKCNIGYYNEEQDEYLYTPEKCDYLILLEKILNKKEGK